jgi:hypothetical protein
MSFFSFKKIGKQEGKVSPAWGRGMLVPVGAGRRWGKGEGGEYIANTVNTRIDLLELVRNGRREG